MAKRTYPAMLEPTNDGVGVSFPDLPGCVSFGVDVDDALLSAHEALSLHLEGMAEDGERFPDPAPLGDRIFSELNGELMKARGSWAQVTAEAPDEGERVNVYLPKSLLERADIWAAKAGMNRSQFVVYALKSIMTPSVGPDASAGGGFQRQVTSQPSPGNRPIRRG